MKRFTQQFQKEATKISLSARERDDLLLRIESYIEYHPLPHTTEVSAPSLIANLRQAEPIRFIRLPRRFFLTSTTFAAMFLFVVVPAMAEQSMPGNILHPIKIHVNEEIRGAFLSGEELARWETERVERRLQEARRLATLGRLTPEIEARVAESVTKQKIVAQAQIATLESDDADAATMATMAMASMFEVQETLLEAARPTEEAVTGELARVIGVSREETENKVNVAVVSETRLLAMIEQHATRAYEILLGIETVIDRGEKENLTRRLTDIERTLSEYTTDVVLTDEEKLTGLRDVWGDLQKIISYMNSLREETTVPVDQVVPIRLTYDERVSKLQDEQVVLGQRVAELLAISEENPEVESLEKVRFMFPLMRESLDLVSTVSPVTIRTVEEGVRQVRSQLEVLERSVPAELVRSTNDEVGSEDEGETDGGLDTEANEAEDEVTEEVVTATTSTEASQ